MPPKATDYYTGRVCYVGHDHTTADGREVEGGWHYTVVVDEEAKQIALDHAKANVALWEKRVGRRGVGRFAQTHLDQARQALAQVEAASFEVPGEKLHLEDTDGGAEFRYRLATAKDEASWYDRKHQQFATIQIEDMAESATRMTPAEYDAAMEAVRKLREEQGGEG